MSRQFHKHIHRNITTGKYAHSTRPILINNWEATYFDFNEEKLMALAHAAKNADIDLLVLDDGWFGHRNGDNSSLGDWYDDTNKLPEGLSGLSAKVHALGLRFGLWVEPEMISPDILTGASMFPAIRALNIATSWFWIFPAMRSAITWSNPSPLRCAARMWIM